MDNFSTFYYIAQKRKTEPKRKFKKGRYKGQQKIDRERQLEKPSTRWGVRGQEIRTSPASSDAPSASTYSVAG